MTSVVQAPPKKNRSIFCQLDGPSPREFYLYRPTYVNPEAPIIVSVHGISMNAAEHMIKMRSLADETGSILIAPYFSKDHYPGYQQLESRKTRSRADLALIEIVEHIAELHGHRNKNLNLVGFSGGAQFAHRFALFHSNRVIHCVSCAAGWYTFPNFDAAYPLGIKIDTGPAEMTVHPDWIHVKHHVIVGSLDCVVEPSLNMRPKIVRQQGVGRLERARRWSNAMTEAFSNHLAGKARGYVHLIEIEGLTHDFSEAHDRFDAVRIISELIRS